MAHYHGKKIRINKLGFFKGKRGGGGGGSGGERAGAMSTNRCPMSTDEGRMTSPGVANLRGDVDLDICCFKKKSGLSIGSDLDHHADCPSTILAVTQQIMSGS